MCYGCEGEDSNEGERYKVMTVVGLGGGGEVAVVKSRSLGVPCYMHNTSQMLLFHLVADSAEVLWDSFCFRLKQFNTSRERVVTIKGTG